MSAICDFPHAHFLSLSKEKMSKKLEKDKIKIVQHNLIKINSSMKSVSNSVAEKLRMTRVESRSGRMSSNGKFGKFGGQYVPELLVSCLSNLEDEFNKALNDPHFQEELSTTLRDYVGRETPLYYAERLTQYYKEKSNGYGPEIYIKREDLNHSGAHKINNAVGQAMLAKRMGCTTIVTATGSGLHGVAAASSAAKLGLECVVVMGHLDIERQPSNVRLMEVLGAQVMNVEGSYRHACSEAIREWIANIDTHYHMIGSVFGPHPIPTMVREFQSVIGKEVRKQAHEKWAQKPDILIACVGGGSNAMGLFHEFVADEGVRLIGVEAAGSGLDTQRHSATLAKGSVGVYQGSMSYLLQDDDGQILDTHSIGVGLEYPGVGSELSYLKDLKRAEFYTVTDQEALHACKRLCRLEGIVPALESSHALAYLEQLCPSLANATNTKVVVCCSGRGDKDISNLSMFHQLLSMPL